MRVGEEESTHLEHEDFGGAGVRVAEEDGGVNVVDDVFLDYFVFEFLNGGVISMSVCSELKKRESII